MEPIKNVGDEGDEVIDTELKDEIIEDAKNWKGSSQTGDYRLKEASTGGGFALRDNDL